MNTAEKKVVQYLSEAHATEDALARVLQSQIAMTPHGAYRSALEQHLEETRQHARRVSGRLSELGAGSNPVTAVIGFWEDMFGQVLALGKAPLDLLRGSGGDEKVLKNAKDTYASEALEIATYTALERLARAVGDKRTADLASEILVEEWAMLERVGKEIPRLADNVVAAEVHDSPTFDVTETGAADTVRGARDAGRDAARNAAETGRRTAEQAHKVPGVAEVEGQVKGVIAGEDQLPIPDYDDLAPDEVIGQLAGLSQGELEKINSYERANENRPAILSRLLTLRGEEPWAGYDELTAAEIEAALIGADHELLGRVRSYERFHKDRGSVLRAAAERTTVSS